MVVDADLYAVQRQGLDRYARGKLGREVGLAAVKAAVQVLGLDRPGVGEHPFDAGARNPAGIKLAVAEGYTQSVGAELVVREGHTAGSVKQDLVERRAAPAAYSAEALDFVGHGDENGGARAARDICPCARGVHAEDPHAR